MTRRMVKQRTFRESWALSFGLCSVTQKYRSFGRGRVAWTRDLLIPAYYSYNNSVVHTSSLSLARRSITRFPKQQCSLNARNVQTRRTGLIPIPQGLALHLRSQRSLERRCLYRLTRLGFRQLQNGDIR